MMRGGEESVCGFDHVALWRREDTSRTLGTSGMCYGRTNVQSGDSVDFTLLWQRRLKKQETKREYFTSHRAYDIYNI